MVKVLLYNVRIWCWIDELKDSCSWPILDMPLGHPSLGVGYVVIEAGYFTELSFSMSLLPSFELFDTVIDGKGRLLVPGLIGKIN